ncbi:MAG: hypothetical protein IPH75_06570 [bacterium]|nr:hypothetical protein [bacterium]
MSKAALSFLLIFLLAAPMVLPLEEFCSEGDDCCDLPCADCYYHCSCSLTFSALPATLIEFANHTMTADASMEFLEAATAPGFALLPDLPPRLS